jgi:putative tryptophan/tyrosine transport system substrate-binding protein
MRRPKLLEGLLRRREFITGIAGATWPLVVRAQVSTKRPLIAWLGGGGESGSSVYVDAFLKGMREFGYVEGATFDIAYRYADGHVERLPLLADELVRLHPSVILAAASGPAVAAKDTTSTIPIVTPALADAVHLGLIASESRPGRNVTGIAPYVAGLPAKQLELAREVVPGAVKIGVLTNLDDPKAPPQWKELEAAGQGLGVKVVAADARTPNDLEAAFRALTQQGINAMIVLQTSMLVTERRRIAALAATARIGR